MSTQFAAEIAFINRRLPNNKVKWELLAVKNELISPALSEDEVKNVIAALKATLGKRAVAIFSKMVFSVSSKLRGGTRIVVSITILREIFGSEIDGDFGGGGKGYNPSTNKPKPPGRGV